MKRVAVIVGTRPDVIKLGPVVDALRAADGLEPFVIASGQHRELADLAAESVGLVPDVSLDVMQADQSLASLGGRLLIEIDRAMEQAGASFVVVQGDTATTLNGTLAAFYRRLPIGHVEAGLRTGDLSAPFPEEANRRLVTPLASLHFAPTALARDNLLAEGVDQRRVIVTGNTIVDALQAEARRQQVPEVARELAERLGRQLGADWQARPSVLLTVHRRESIGPALEGIIDAIAALSERFGDHLFCLPVHPNPRVRAAIVGRLGNRGNVRLLEPLPYRDLVYLLRHCRLVLTDSGGIQEEAPVFGKPVVVMRATTERPEGIQAGVALLAGVERDSIVSAAAQLLTDQRSYAAMAQAVSPYGDGRAAGRIVATIKRYLAGEDATGKARAASSRCIS
jgi:UDP-N-acetylglucosamine 2-epimerase (non-hydrolysing)